MFSSIKQITLPTFDLRPICPVCRKSANCLGQYDPYHPAMICRECSMQAAVPIELWEPHPRKPGELRIVIEGFSKEKEKRIVWGNRIRDAIRKRPEAPPRSVVYMGWLREAQAQPTQLELPVCLRCGKPEPISEYGHAQHCPKCDAEMGADSVFRMRSVLLADCDDIEAQLDKLFRVYPEWFSCGVMPDYWFKLHRNVK